MSVLLWIIAGIGVIALLAVGAFFGAIFIDMGKELKGDRQHAKKIFEHGKVALTGKFAENYPTPKSMLLDRSTIPYADEESFGTDDRYLLALAAPFNAHRCKSTMSVGGYFDRVKYIDPDLGPVNEDDKEILRKFIVDFERIENAAHLTDILESRLLREMSYEVSQVLALNGHDTVPDDMAALYEKGTVDGYQRGIDKHPENTPALDLRTYRLIMLIHYARIGATLEWIPEREAWAHIRRIGVELRARVCRYESWEQYGEMLLQCHRYLIEQNYVSKRLASQLRFLKSEKCSPWKKLSLHHSEAQKAYAKTVRPLELKMPEPFVANTDFAELRDGRYLDAGDRLIGAANCDAIVDLVLSGDILDIPQSTLDDLVIANPDHAGIHLLAGHHASEAGFKARGDKTANWVSEEAFATLQERTQRACDLARRGFELAPDHHGFVGLVISAVDHTGRMDEYQDLSRKAFELAGTTHIVDLALQMQLMRPLLEKWGGSVNASFGMAEDRMARSENPLAALLYIYAAIEYVSLGSMCGGSDDRHKDFSVRDGVHKAATDLLVISDPQDARRVRRWLTYWAYAADDLDMLLRIGPFDGSFSFDSVPWIYVGPTKARVLLALYRDIATVAGDREWLRLTGFYEDTARPDGLLQ